VAIRFGPGVTLTNGRLTAGRRLRRGRL